MTEVLRFPSSPSSSSSYPPSPSPSSSSSSPAPDSLSCVPSSSSFASPPNSAGGPFLIDSDRLPRNPVSELVENVDFEGSGVTGCGLAEEEEELRRSSGANGGDQLSLLALLITIFRKSIVSCKSGRRELCTMEIGCPTNVRHVAHVTFDRFNGFLGLPVEFEPEVPRRAPSASATVFGVSTDSMQLSFDSRGNCVPTILLLMQNCLYTRGGLQAEGIFRITAENSEEEAVREQLNRGVIPEGVDVHCLAGLIKAWFRELPTGVLDSLSPEQVVQCQREEEYVELVRLLPPTEASLLDWAINLMADVVQHEHFNKMNSRNIAMVFAPNMTQMADPLTALMYAVQVMNFLKTLIERTLREREESMVEPPNPIFSLEPSDESGHQSPSQSSAYNIKEDKNEPREESQADYYIGETRFRENSSPLYDISNEDDDDCEGGDVDDVKRKRGQTSDSGQKNAERSRPQVVGTAVTVGRSKGMRNLSRVNSRVERIEAWR